MKRSVLLFLLFSYSTFAQKLYFEESQNSPLRKKEIITIKGVGFIESVIDDTDLNKTYLRTRFYNQKGELLKNNSFSLIRADYLGYVTNGKDHRFIFLDTYNNKISIPTYDHHGNLLGNQASRIRGNIKNASIGYYDNEAYYTMRRKGPTFTYTKVSYNYDTIWHKEVFDKGKTTWFIKADKIKDRSFLIFNSPEASTRIIAIDDQTGKDLVDKELEEGSIRRRGDIFFFDKEHNQIIVKGIEGVMQKKKYSIKSEILARLNMGGEIVDKRDIAYSTAKSVEPSQGKESIPNLQTTEIIKVGSSIAMIGENVERVDLVGGQVVARVAFSIISSAIIGVPMLGGSEADKEIIFTTKDLGVFYRNKGGDSLNFERIEKSPIEKYFPTSYAYSGRTNDVYDYKFSREVVGGKQLLFFHSLDSEKLTIGAVTLTENSPSITKKYEVKAKNEKGVNFQIYPLSDEHLLLESITKSTTSYEVIPYSAF